MAIAFEVPETVFFFLPVSASGHFFYSVPLLLQNADDRIAEGKEHLGF